MASRPICLVAVVIAGLIGLAPVTAQATPSTTVIISNRSTTGPAWTSIRLPEPAGATNVFADEISCPAAGHCTAAGGDDSSATQPDLVWDETGNSWRLTQLRFPTGAILPQSWGPDSLSCWAPGDCAALTGFVQSPGSSNSAKTALFVERNGTWTTSVMPAVFGQYGYNWNTIACQSTGVCTAMGGYGISQKTPQSGGVTATFTPGGTITPEAIPVPAGAVDLNGESLAALAESCPATGGCTGVFAGQVSCHINSSGGSVCDETVATDGDGSWRSALLAAGSSQDYYVVNALSCPESPWCIAPGIEWVPANPSPPTKVTTAYLETEVANGSFSPASVAIPPSEPGTSSAFSSGACISAQACTLAGSSTDKSGKANGFLETLANGEWSDVIPPLPPGAASQPLSTIVHVACSAAGICAAQGRYTDSAGNRHLVFYLGSGKNWTVSKAVVPAGATGEAILGMSCDSAGACAVAGEVGISGDNVPYVFLSPQAGLAVSSVEVSKPLSGDVDSEIPITLSPANGKEVRVDYVTEAGSAKAGRDYTAVSGVVKFAPGATSGEIPVKILGGKEGGPPLDFNLKLSNASNKVPIVSPSATVTINEAPKASVAAVTVPRPYSSDSTADVPVTLSRPATEAVSVAYRTENGTGVAGKDYETATGTVTFPAGATKEKVPIKLLVNPEAPGAEDEDFSVVIADPTPDWLQLSDTTAKVTITTRVTVSSVSPDVGSPAGGQVVKLTGTGFGPAGSDDASVLMCDDATTSSCSERSWNAIGVTVLSETSIQMTIPPWEGHGELLGQEKDGVEVVVTPASGSPQRSDPATAGYTYKIVVDKVSPSTASPVGGQTITIHGSGFGPADTGVSVNLCPVAVLAKCNAEGLALTGVSSSVLSNTTITTKVPKFDDRKARGDEVDPKVSYYVDVTLKLLDYTYHASNATPTTALFAYAVSVTSITPNSGPPSGRQDVTLHGSGFEGSDTPEFVYVWFCVLDRGSCTAHKWGPALADLIDDSTLTAKTPDVDLPGSSTSEVVGVYVEIYTGLYGAPGSRVLASTLLSGKAQKPTYTYVCPAGSKSC
jgi:hypothetical protein